MNSIANLKEKIKNIISVVAIVSVVIHSSSCRPSYKKPTDTSEIRAVDTVTTKNNEIEIQNQIDSKSDTFQAGQNSEVVPAEPENQNVFEVAIYSSRGKLLRKEKCPVDPDWIQYVNYIKGYPTDDTIYGVFNGDGKKEKAWFIDKGEEAFQECQSSGKNCTGIIRFSDKNIKRLYISYCPMHTFKNEGDLNGDGRDEIGVLPGWFTSASRKYHVFTYRDSVWKEACAPINSSMNMREAGLEIIDKHPRDSGYVLIRESLAWAEDKFPGFIYPDSIGPYSSQNSPVVEYKLKLK